MTDAVPHFVFTLMTNNTNLAAQADAAGVDRIGIDLEILGKTDRQSAKHHWISDHTVEDVPAVQDVISRAALFARLNPIHETSEEECARVLNYGAKVVMLPFFRTAREVAKFVHIVQQDAIKVLLVETPEALQRLDQILDVHGIDEIHFGLNDLHLGLGLNSHFDILRLGLLDDAVDLLRARDIPFGIAGVSRPSQENLPMPPSLLLAQLVRLGATRSLISRSFFMLGDQGSSFKAGIHELRNALADLANMPSDKLDELHDQFNERVERLNAVRNN